MGEDSGCMWWLSVIHTEKTRATSPPPVKCRSNDAIHGDLPMTRRTARNRRTGNDKTHLLDENQFDRILVSRSLDRD